jgi:hypothetical protein
MEMYAPSTKEEVEKSVRGYHRTFGWTFEIVETTPEIQEQVKQFKISEEKRFKENSKNSKRFGVHAKPIPWTLAAAKRYIKS